MYNTFYPPKARSPITELAQQIEPDDTMFDVINGGALPDAPNKCTIGAGEDSETVLYKQKDGNTLSDVTRGFEPSGSQKTWPEGTKVARVLTAQDIAVLQETLDEHLTDYEEPHEYEDVSDDPDYEGVKYRLVVEKGEAFLEVTES